MSSSWDFFFFLFLYLLASYWLILNAGKMMVKWWLHVVAKVILQIVLPSRALKAVIFRGAPLPFISCCATRTLALALRPVECFKHRKILEASTAELCSNQLGQQTIMDFLDAQDITIYAYRNTYTLVPNHHQTLKNYPFIWVCRHGLIPQRTNKTAFSRETASHLGVHVWTKPSITLLETNSARPSHFKGWSCAAPGPWARMLWSRRRPQVRYINGLHINL